MIDGLIVITGASSGIGRETALFLASEGNALVLAARSQDKLKEVVSECLELGARVCAYQVTDVTNWEDCSRLAQTAELVRTSGSLGSFALVNIAGLAQFGELAETDPASIQEQVHVNLLGLAFTCRAFVPMMLAQSSAQIINLLSVASVHTFPGAGAYCASKAGALAFSRCLSQEVRGRGVRVTALLPGAVDTPAWDKQATAPERKDMLSTRAVAETIRDLLAMPPDRSIDEMLLMPPKGVL